MDWNDLTSRSLPSLGGLGGLSGGVGVTTGGGAPQDTQHWNRSLASLQIASQALLDQTPGGGLGARWRLSGSSGSGAAGGVPPSIQQKQQLPRTSASEAVSQYEESILERIRQQPEESIRENTNNAIVDYLQSSWERKHNQWLDELLRAQNTGGNKNNSNAYLMSDLTNRSSPRSRSVVVASNAPGGRRSMIGGAWPQTNNTSGRNDTRLDPQMIYDHGVVVRDLPRFVPEEAARQFGILASKGGKSPASSGYTMAWKWMEHLLQLQQQNQRGIDVTAPRGGSKYMAAVDQAVATARHLSQQYYGDVERAVQAAVMAGQNDLLQETYNDPVAVQCEAYTKILIGTQALETPWPVLYYCLRCGSGSDAALDVWQTSKTLAPSISDTVADSITRLLVAMKPWGSHGGGTPQLSVNDRHIVADYLQSLQQSDEGDGDNNQPSVHQVGFLSLLSGTGEPPVAGNIRGFSTIEDYLFGRITHALLQRDAEAELVKLGGMIQSYGASYFGDSESGGWSFSLPLLMTQQYSKALTHLVECGGNFGLLQATHLGLLLSTASIELKDLGQTDPNPNGDLAASLLVTYAGRLLAEPTAGSLAALEYLVLIPKRDRLRKEVASLIAKTGDLDKLAGRADENGIRHGGEALERKFSSEELAAVLVEAAEMLLRESGDKQKLGTAAMCYMLAGRYDNVLRVLNDMISPPNEQNPTRQFWMEQTKQFHQYYLEKRTHVWDVLQREGKLNLIQTSQHLMELNTFFQHLHVGQFSDAWTIASRTGLLPRDPRDRNDIAVKQDMYRTGLDDSVKRSFPPFLVGVMKSLQQMHHQTKIMGNARDAVTADRLRELQEYARMLVGFAGLMGVASDGLSQMEAMML